MFITFFTKKEKMNYFQLLKQFHDIYDKLSNKTVKRQTIVNHIKRSIPFEECIIYNVATMSLPPGKFNVSGLYSPDRDEQGKPCIEIEIAFPVKHTFTFNDSDLRREHWAELCIDLASTLGHEFIHLNQFRRRNFEWTKVYRSDLSNSKLKQIQEYYGDSDEVEAYAFMAATELCINKITEEKINPNIKKTNVYKTYTSVFKKDDPIIQKLIRLTETYTKKLEKQYHATTFQ